jgi:hypothetical protein
MASTNQKIIVVVGATGNQGSSVAHTFLSLPNWHVRCLTRNPSSAASLALAAQGTELVQGDLSNLTSLTPAFDNANAIFLNTDFWATYAASMAAGKGEESGKIAYDHEVMLGKNAVVAAAKVLELESFVYSALGPMAKHSKGKFAPGYHWGSKAAIVEYIEGEVPSLAKNTSFIYLGGYSTNAFLAPKLDPTSGKYQFIVPMKKHVRMPIIDPKVSTGLFVRELIETEKPGVKLLAYDKDSYLSVEEIADVWKRAKGKETVVVEVTVEYMHQQFGVPMEVLDGPSYIEEFGYMGGVVGFIEPSQLKSEVPTKSFEKWLMEQTDE